MNFNKVILVGNLTRDPEKRALPSGQAVVNFGLATNRYYTAQDGQKKQEVEFHNIVIFGKTAEIAAQYLRKGSMALIEGRLRTRNWQDQAGITHYRTEIITDRLQLGPRPAGWQGQPGFQAEPTQASQVRPQAQNQGAINKEDIPVIQEDDIQPSSEPNSSQPEEDIEENPGAAGQASNPFDEAGEEEIDVKKIPF